MTAGLAIDAARSVFWVPRADCGRAQREISAFLSSTTVMPVVKAALQEVLLELDVTRVREAVWPEGVENARVAKNLSGDLLPILMSDTERESLRAVPVLPDSLRTAIEGGLHEPPIAPSPPRLSGT